MLKGMGPEEGKDEAALMLMATGKFPVLKALYGGVNRKVADFMKKDFKQAHNREIAAKNAFRLLSTHRYPLAIVFFLLAERFDDAVSVAKEELADLPLAVFLWRMKPQVITHHNDMDGGGAAEGLRAYFGSAVMREARENGDPALEALSHWWSGQEQLAETGLMSPELRWGSLAEREAILAALRKRRQASLASWRQAGAGKEAEGCSEASPPLSGLERGLQYMERGFATLALEALATESPGHGGRAIAVRVLRSGLVARLVVQRLVSLSQEAARPSPGSDASWWGEARESLTTVFAVCEHYAVLSGGVVGQVRTLCVRQGRLEEACMATAHVQGMEAAMRFLREESSRLLQVNYAIK